MMKKRTRNYIRFTVTFEAEVENLADYSAKTIEEAAENQRKWLADDPETLVELIGFASGGPPYLLLTRNRVNLDVQGHLLPSSQRIDSELECLYPIRISGWAGRGKGCGSQVLDYAVTDEQLSAFQSVLKLGGYLAAAIWVVQNFVIHDSRMTRHRWPSEIPCFEITREELEDAHKETEIGKAV